MLITHRNVSAEEAEKIWHEVPLRMRVTFNRQEDGTYTVTIAGPDEYTK